MMVPAAALEELQALNRDLDHAADAILDAAEAGFAALGDAAAQPALAAALETIMGACAFQDLAGQRIDKIRRLLAGAVVAEDGLENGPALTGQGLDQAAADALFAGRT